MNKEEIKKWLQDNKDKSEEEIKTYLLSAINKDGFGESWTKDYFLEDLKNHQNGFTNNVLGAVSKVQKENKNNDKKIENKNKKHIIPRCIFGISIAWIFGYFGLIFYILGFILGFLIAKKMLDSKDYIRIIFWILLVLSFLGGTIIRTIQKESMRSSVINEYQEINE